MATAAEHVRVTLGGCDVLGSNVGVQQFGAIDKLAEQDWEWVLNVNVLGTVRTVRKFLPMLRAGHGFRRIVFNRVVEAMIAHQPMVDGDHATPEHAIRNLLADLEAGEPYVLTNGSYRPLYRQRRDALDAAFDRMEAS